MSVSVLRIEKRRQPAHVRMVGGEALDGVFFLSGQAQQRFDGQSLADLLGDAERQFVPLLVEDGQRVTMVNTSRIAWVQVEEDKAVSTSNEGLPKPRVAVSVRVDENLIEASLSACERHPDRRRVVDLLNHPDAFVSCLTHDGPCLINKVWIDYVEPR